LKVDFYGNESSIDTLKFPFSKYAVILDFKWKVYP